MPAPDFILAPLEAIANEWWRLALIWHIHVLCLLGAVLLRRKVSMRVAAIALSAPLASAAALAIVSQNPFNSLVLGATLIGALFIAWRMPKRLVVFSPAFTFMPGAAMTIFGLLYPHFLEAASILTYAYAAPVGLVPCPTLSAIVGISLATNLFQVRAWSLLAGAAGLTYGLIGALYLRVWIDLALVAGAALLVFATLVRSDQRVVTQPSA